MIQTTTLDFEEIRLAIAEYIQKRSNGGTVSRYNVEMTRPIHKKDGRVIHKQIGGLNASYRKTYPRE